ncbi:MAG: response regulator [Proteobacteria bacterium]|nr:MAG: response regulator [Pseudomonadota bacterium]
MSIATRLALMFSLLSLVPLAVSGTLAYLRFYEGQKQAAYRSLNTLAANKHARFEQWIDDNVRSIRELARRPAVRTFTQNIIEFDRAGFRQDYFANWLRDNHLVPMTVADRDMREVFLVDAASGKKLASSDSRRVGQFVTGHEYFQRGRSGTWVQPLHYPLTLDDVSMTAATPVQGSSGEVIAVLGAHLDLDIISAIFQQGFENSPSLDSYLVNRFNSLVTRVRFSEEDASTRAVHTTGIDRCLTGEDGEDAYVDYHGVPVLGSFRWLDRWEMCLVVEVNATEAMGQATRLRTFVIILFFGVAFVVASLIGFVSRQVSRPIIEVVEATEKIGRGNLDVCLPDRGDGEIGRLFDGLNRMTENLGRLTASRDELDREIAEKELAARSLEESERRMNILMSNLPGMAYRCYNEPDWRMVFVSEGCKTLTGYDPADLIENAKTSYQELIHPGDRNRIWKSVQEAVAADRHYEAEYRIRTAKGSWRWVWEKGRSVSPKGQTPEILEGFIHDITERRRLARELQQAQKMELLGQVTGGVAHDFNNLLGVILGYSGLARANVPATDERLSRYLGHITHAGERAREIVSQMLAFSRGEHSDDEVIDVKARVLEEIGMIRSSLPASILIDIDLEDPIPAIELQTAQLNQVLMNLCINARDAMNGKGKIGIQLRYLRDVSAECMSTRQQFRGEYVELAVSDTGTGLPPEHTDRIFDPFFTTKPAGKGSGLGLAVVDGIVRGHGGHIVVESEPGEGTRFRLFFPIASNPVVDKGGEEQTTGDPVDGGGRRLLIVDDEETLAGYIAEYLESYNFRTETYASSDNALDAFSSDPGRFDLLITDQTMPGLSGLELAQRIRTIRPGFPIILCTGFSELVNAEIAKKQDIGFLVKPVDPDKLLRQLTQSLS